MRKETDLTTRKIGSKFQGKVIAECPKCGRPGTITKLEGPKKTEFLSILHKFELIWNGQAQYASDSCTYFEKQEAE